MNKCEQIFRRFDVKVAIQKKTVLIVWLILGYLGLAQEAPAILASSATTDKDFLPDFSYAGYQFGEKEIPEIRGTIVRAVDYGVVADDGLDDSKAMLKALEATKTMEGPIVLQLPKGRLILSDILYLERSNFVFRGTGTSREGTEIFCPRPMMYLQDPPVLAELREYLKKFDKYQREPENNIDLPFSQFAWSGGMLWTQVPGERVKSYLGKYDKPQKVLAKVAHGKIGEHSIAVSEVIGLKVGDVVELQLFNKTGEHSALIKDLYKGTDLNIGSHHWNFPTLPIVRQQVQITGIKEGEITIKTPLTISVVPEYEARLVPWNHLTEVGMEHFRITFPEAPYVAHHVERGFNGIFLTRLFNSWVKDVVIENADSGILTEEIANVTITDISTMGNSKSHYTVHMGGVHNVLVNHLKVRNPAQHPLSFNTFSSKNVYKDCEVFVDPILDQHSGANHQNLFDNIKVYVNPLTDNSYPLFHGGGAPYWKPTHGAFSTFWNIQVFFESGLDTDGPILLNGMQDGPFARIIGVHGNHACKVEYGPQAHIEFTNRNMDHIPSLYDYQLKRRLGRTLLTTNINAGRN